MKSLINWSEVSRLLISDRSQIRSDYSGKKYAKIIARIKRVEKALIWFITHNEII